MVVADGAWWELMVVLVGGDGRSGDDGRVELTVVVVNVGWWMVVGDGGD